MKQATSSTKKEDEAKPPTNSKFPPKSLPPFAADARVTLHGLKGRPEWNGRSGTVLCFYTEGSHQGRCGIQLDGPQDDMPFAAIKPQNLKEEKDYRPYSKIPYVNKIFDLTYQLKQQGKMDRFRHEYLSAMEHAAIRGQDGQTAHMMAQKLMTDPNFDTETVVAISAYLEIAVEQGHVPAMFALGRYKVAGYGDRKKSNSKGATRLLQRAAKHDYTPAISMLGGFCQLGLLKEAPEKADEYFERAARLGDAEAAFYLGVSYRDGDSGVEPDRELALAWFRHAGDQGNEDGEASYWALKRDVNFVPGSIKEPVHTFEQLAEGAMIAPDDRAIQDSKDFAKHSAVFAAEMDENSGNPWKN